jgi:hypothetical protein
MRFAPRTGHVGCPSAFGTLNPSSASGRLYIKQLKGCKINLPSHPIKKAAALQRATAFD